MTQYELYRVAPTRLLGLDLRGKRRFTQGEIKVQSTKMPA